MSFKIEVFTIRNSFSCLHETEDRDEILSGFSNALSEGIIKLANFNPNTGLEEITIIPREKIEYIKIIPLNPPSEKEDKSNEF